MSIFFVCHPRIELRDRRRVASLPISKFHGVGPVTAAKMQRLGIRTGADLRAKSLAFLEQHFGKSATWYLGIANGDDERPVVADRPRKSSGSETEPAGCHSGGRSKELMIS